MSQLSPAVSPRYLLLTSLRFPDCYIFDRLVISRLSEDNKIPLLTVKYGQFSTDGDWLSYPLELQVEAVGRELLLGFSAKMMNLQANEVAKVITMDREQPRQVITVETELCTFEVAYKIRSRQQQLELRDEPSPIINAWQQDTIKQQQYCKTTITQSLRVVDVTKPQNEQQLLQLRSENMRLQEQLASLHNEMSGYQKSLSEEFSVIESRSNTLMVKSLRHQKNELQLKNQWEKERQDLMAKIVRMREMLDKVVIL